MLTPEQRQQRKSCLGSSDMAAVLGLDPFKNAADVYLEKTGKLKEQEETKVMKRGNYLEPAILNFAQDILGNLNRNVLFKAPGDLPLASNVDAEVIQTGYAVEAKSVGLFVNEHWGEESSDEIPDRVIIQCHVHMICTCTDFCHVPVYLSAREFVMFGVKLSEKIVDVICTEAASFWYNCVQKDTPPENVVPAESVMKRIRREPKTIVDIPPIVETLVTQWQEKNTAFTVAKKEKEAANAEVINLLGVSEAGQLANGDMVTYLSQSRKMIDSKRLTAEKPDIAAEYLKTIEYPVLRLKKAK
jgi:putative phage-type endonuclease